MQLKVSILRTEELIANLEKISKNLGMGAKSVLNQAAEMTKKQMQHNVPVMTGDLKNSIDWWREGDATRIIGPWGPASHSLRSPMLYAQAVEEGARAHFPPVDDIARRYAVSGRVAWAIAKRISERSGPARHFGEMTAVWAREEFYNMVVKMAAFA